MNKILGLLHKKPKRLKLREWAQVETLRRKMEAYAKRGGYLPVGQIIVQIINLCGIKGSFNKKPWYYTVSVFAECSLVNQPTTEIPLLKAKEKGEDVPWDYIGRDWYWWVNLFAHNYGWKSEDVAKLDIDDAVALLQEIQVDEQMEKEWRYGLSELAYEYVPSTKKSKFRPLPRPDWMMVTKENYKPKTPKKVKILASMMPMGNIVNLDEETDANTSPKPN